MVLDTPFPANDGWLSFLFVCFVRERARREKSTSPNMYTLPKIKTNIGTKKTTDRVSPLDHRRIKCESRQARKRGWRRGSLSRPFSFSSSFLFPFSASEWKDACRRRSVRYLFLYFVTLYVPPVFLTGFFFFSFFPTYSFRLEEKRKKRNRE